MLASFWFSQSVLWTFRSVFLVAMMSPGIPGCIRPGASGLTPTCSKSTKVLLHPLYSSLVLTSGVGFPDHVSILCCCGFNHTLPPAGVFSQWRRCWWTCWTSAPTTSWCPKGTTRVRVRVFPQRLLQLTSSAGGDGWQEVSSRPAVANRS